MRYALVSDVKMADIDDYDDSTFVTIGTPFQPLEEEGNEDNKLVYARDRKPGETYRERRERQRFHGAFTGGFSAGYYNTVGSKEGWRPSTFVSSRRGKSEAVSSKPEDFMDTEDLGKFGIAPRRVAPTRDFTVDSQDVDELGRLLGNKRSRSVAAGSVLSDLFGDSFLKNLVVPTRTSIGTTLMKTMGWKEGQGVGPRTAQKTTNAEEGPTKVYGCSLPSNMDSKDSDKFLFAPGDIRPWILVAKDDLHGIGYSGIMEERIEGMRGQNRSSGLYGMFGQAFGIGALEEEDDEEVYTSDNIANYSLAAVGEGDVERDDKFGWTGPHSTESWSLKAFKRSKRCLKLQKVYPPPELPKGYTPKHAPVSSEKKKVEDQRDYSRRHHLDATTRGHLIGEGASVFSLMKPEDQARIRSLAAVEDGNGDNRRKRNRWDQPSSTGVSKDHQGGSAKELFGHDSKKQLRFEAYSKQSSTYYELTQNMTEWEVQKEREEFAKTAALQSQLSKSLSSKFAKEGEGVNSTGSSTGHQSSSDKRDTDHSVKPATASKTGPLVREVLEWHPHRILCKRLDVPDPFPNSPVVGLVNKSKKTTKMDQFVNQAKVLHWSLSSNKADTDTTTSGVDSILQSGGGLLKPSDTDSQVVSEENSRSFKDDEGGTSTDDTTTKVDVPSDHEERPSMDIFKAIFADSEASDSPSDSEEEDSVPGGSHSQEVEPTKVTNLQEVRGGPDQHAQEVQDKQDEGTQTVQHTQDKTIQGVQNTQHSKHSDTEQSSVASHRNSEVHSTAGSTTAKGEDTVMDVSSREQPQVTEPPVTYGPVLPPSYNEECSDSHMSPDDDQPVEAGSRHKHHHKKKDKRKHKHKDKKDKHKKHKRKMH